MISDARMYWTTPGQPPPQPPWVRVLRSSDRKWFDPDAQQWVDKPSASRKLAYVQPDPQTYPTGFILAIETPAAIWGVDQEVWVFVHDADSTNPQMWADWFYVTVNPTFQIAGYHFVAEANKPGSWFFYQPQIK